MSTKNKAISSTTLSILSYISAAICRDASLISAQSSHLSKLDWQKIAQISARYKITSLIASAINISESQYPIPSEFQQWFNSKLVENKKKSLKLSFHLCQIVEELSQAGIHAIPYKGLVLSHIAYRDFSLRTFDDLDILLHEKDFFEPINLLKNQGYSTLPNIYTTREQEAKYSNYVGEYPLISDKTATCIDVHHQLIGSGNLTLDIDFRHIWERLEPVSFCGRIFWTLSLEDMFIYQSINAWKDGWHTIRSVSDIGGLIANNPEIKWDRVLVEARRLKVECPVYLAILLADKFLNISAPVEIFTHAQQDPGALYLLNLVHKRLLKELDDEKYFRPTYNFELKWVALRYSDLRIFYVVGLFRRLLKQFFMLNYKDIQFVHVPKQVKFIYYFIRPVRIMVEHKNNILRVLFK